MVTFIEYSIRQLREIGVPVFGGRSLLGSLTARHLQKLGTDHDIQLGQTLALLPHQLSMFEVCGACHLARSQESLSRSSTRS